MVWFGASLQALNQGIVIVPLFDPTAEPSGYKTGLKLPSILW